MYSTHIAAIKSTGNMFSYEAIEELNIKPKSFRDLLTDEPYQRKDLIIVQDPALTDKFNLNSFHHIKNKLKVDDDGKLTYCTFISKVFYRPYLVEIYINVISVVEFQINIIVFCGCNE